MASLINCLRNPNPGVQNDLFYLTSANGISLQGYNEDIPSKAELVSIPRQHGGLLDEIPKLGPRVISLTGIIQGETAEIYRTNTNAFKKFLEIGLQKYYKFDDRYIWVNKASLSNRDFITAKGGEFALDLICADPFFYSDIDSSNVFATSATTYQFAIATLGDAPSLPIITFSTLVTYGNLANAANSQSFRYTNTHATVVVDCAAFTATEAGDNGLSNFTGEFLQLESGANVLTFTQPTAAAVTITVAWTDRYY